MAASLLPYCRICAVLTDVHSRRYSLSIAEENKPAFLLSRNERGEAGEENSQPLETVIAMAASRDPDVRRSIAVSLPAATGHCSESGLLSSRRKQMDLGFLHLTQHLLNHLGCVFPRPVSGLGLPRAFRIRAKSL